MSIHPSLAMSEKDKKHRTVLKRAERIKLMLEKGQWKEGDSIFGLPKIKSLRIKIKKEKAKEVEAEVTAAQAETPTTETKEQAPLKSPAPKGKDLK
jgi:small basic protein (TIGR04137 family)